MFVKVDKNEFNINVNNVLHELTLTDKIQYSNNASQILHDLTLSDKFNFSNKLNDILIKYDSFPATFRNQIRNLSYDLSKESANFTTNLNILMK